MTTEVSKDMRYNMITRAQKQLFNMNTEVAKKLFNENSSSYNQELELHIYRAIRVLLKNDNELCENLMADIETDRSDRSDRSNSKQENEAVQLESPLLESSLGVGIIDL